MEESEFNDPRGYRGKELHESAQELEQALRRMERDMRHAERERMHAIKNAFKSGGIACAGVHGTAASGPRTVEEVLVEIDSYLFYLEDMPKDRLAPHESRIDDIAGHLEKVRSSLKNMV